MENSQTDSKNRFLNLCLKSQTNFTILLVSIFFILSFIGLFHHEMWRDELQAWLIARDSSSLIDVYNNLKYEGHPGLWHSLLYIITRFTNNPIGMQFLHLLIATLVIYIFVQYSPFTRIQKILFTFGYFPFFEYNLISRNYNLGILFLVLFCYLFPKRYHSYLWLAILMALMLNTNVYIMIIALSLALTLVIEYIFDQNLRNAYFHNKRNIIFSITIFFLGLIISLSQLIRTTTITSQSPASNTIVLTQFDLLINSIKKLAGIVALIAKSYIPIPQFFNFQFWNTSIFPSGISLILSIILLCLAICIFIRKPLILLLYLSGTFGILLFAYLKIRGVLRHHGHLFILFIACLWLCNYYSNSNWLYSRFQRFINFWYKQKDKLITSILLLHLFAGIFAFSMDLVYPFSASKEAANFIISNQLNNNVIVGSKDYIMSPLAALLNRKIYYPQMNGFSSFVDWGKRKDVKSQRVIEEVNNFVAQTNNQILLILDSPLNTEPPTLRISQLKSFSKNLVGDEKYYLYLVQKK
ncbi:hypothetical protein QUB80_15380 [Chlorogloeopsis sp. ULAP01]|uniref:hypothetical protein n=1 Tax=Chlorogloeopsis sp. ULAP01 TaxID=3056483 RepID=UPI0025AA8FC5|nr:hypothetical protein [Chlorogloeopsis sp. ULAP01]MDM9382083.1 hypothetical protein [Chlorogloeopsis sp. ULAP01]